MKAKHMTSRRIRNVLKKEWEVMGHDLNALLFVTLLPLIITGQGILYVFLISRFGGETLLASAVIQKALENLKTAIPAVSNLPQAEKLLVLLLSQSNLYLLIIPLMIAVSFATFSIVDEKITHSLEALLATPVRTWELLLGKTLAGAVPAIVITWICAGVFLLGVVALGWGNLIGLMLTPPWFISLFLMTPAVSLLSFMLGVIGSSRAKDARSAQNISVIVILPIFVFIGVQITGQIWFTPLLSFVLAFAILVIDAFVLRAAVKLFQRESIIISWRR